MSVADYLDSPRMIDHALAAIAALLAALIVFSVAALDEADQPPSTVPAEARP